jgi:hypothetical protein
MGREVNKTSSGMAGTPSGPFLNLHCDYSHPCIRLFRPQLLSTCLSACYMRIVLEGEFLPQRLLFLLHITFVHTYIDIYTLSIPSHYPPTQSCHSLDRLQIHAASILTPHHILCREHIIVRSFEHPQRGCGRQDYCICCGVCILQSTLRFIGYLPLRFFLFQGQNHGDHVPASNAS